ncbi:MAG: hypothetical protein QNJ72_21535 [Pleurocapsa sp. MO_226.B13]|nr:hypothetical protein [Pleurocapsa sp. MO_226.B13]
MGVVQFDIQKIEQLLNSATSERQRKMYQALLNKARRRERASSDSKASGTTPETETQTKTTKKKKATRQSATTSASPAIPQSTTPVPESTTQLTEEESELKSRSKEPEKQQQPNAVLPMFQAIGAVVATPYIKDEHLKMAIDGGEYDLLYTQGFRRRAYNLLKAKLEKNGSSPMFLRLYPKAKFEPNSQQPRLFFSLVNFSSNCEQIKDEPQGFMLRGIWQYIPNSKSPVISIYRNRDQWGYFKKLSKSRQFNFVQPHHIPVVWDATVEPFKFNPQAETGEQMPRYFVEVRAIFKDGLYVVEEMLGEPTLDIPKSIKVPKKK